MKMIIFLVFFSTIGYAKWVMFGANNSEVFLYNDESGETFRYFEQDGATGFAKQNFYRTSTTTTKGVPTTSTKSSTQNQSAQQNQQNPASTTDLQKIQNLLLNNGATNPVNLLNEIYQ